ncbi:hypothetical protein BDV95DRAFT_629423 [Massariosphaeria phaeospora]|uniref:mRNA N(6)-methyladenine demethylase n=1 Tax=Massariosphaeria phaeospora TaxID=100035 RepID=A0A7C8IBT3_9PLEO|nr:hypothetical protein BDV95DRAFT_629423 [Massariosphaeria phaeospora]
MQSLDPHQRPPEAIRNVYKKYQKMRLKDIDQDLELIDLDGDLSAAKKAHVSMLREIDVERLATAFRAFAGQNLQSMHSVPVYEIEDIPGLQVIPSLVPPEVQRLLLTRLLHRDLSDPSHLTNIHTHYDVSYPRSNSSFFSQSPGSVEIAAQPLDPSIHRPITVTQLLNRKMRWMTLGGQYDWTQKRYPSSPSPAFPLDIKQLLEGVFPATKAEAAIVNLYSPGDTLSVHRDVAEECGKGLISVSLGCDAIFVIGLSSDCLHQVDAESNARLQPPEKTLALRLRSGSAVYMSGESRFAWHGVPQIIPDTCPGYLRNWPNIDDGDEFAEWKGWMANKRINLNVRQMTERSAK